MQALITNIQGFSLHDGPGIRTVVFLKGCGLSCRWCANPECISPRAQTGFIETLCTHCGKCAATCPNAAINTDPAGQRIDRSRCEGCGKCADACYYGALVRYGEPMGAEEVFETVRRDKMFFGDGGGVTASGGEPLLQADFVRRLFELCKTDGISTCIETSGFAPSESLYALLPLTDRLLFDLKLMNPKAHFEYMGASNELILANAAMASGRGADILFRMPLIPGVNDGAENIEATAKFIKSLGRNHKIQLMPYHRAGSGKYQALDMPNPLRNLEIMPRDRIEAARAAFTELGVECSISE